MSDTEADTNAEEEGALAWDHDDLADDAAPETGELRWDAADLDDYQPPKEDIYYRVMEIIRRKKRQEFVGNAPKVKSPVKHVDEECKRTDPRLSISKSWVDSSDKQRASANQTYKDFLLHKRTEISRERTEEFQCLAFDEEPYEPREYYSLGEGDTRLQPPEKRRHSYGGENIDRAGDIDNILDEGPINWNIGEKKDGKKVCGDFEKDELDAKIDYLVDDKYYPGLIDDAVNKKVDFHQVSFDLTFGADKEPPTEMPELAPISLIEAFDLRVAKEQGARKKIMKVAPPPKSPHTEVEDMGKSFASFLKDKTSPTRVINREEVMLANAVDVELEALVRNKPLTGLTKAIHSLQKAEIMNEYDKSLQAAEEAYSKAPPELAESAAVHKATTFLTEELSKKTTSVGGGKSYRPIEIVSYMGITKPIVGEAIAPSCRNQ